LSVLWPSLNHNAKPVLGDGGCSTLIMRAPWGSIHVRYIHVNQALLTSVPAYTGVLECLNSGLAVS
jgi:hypothetical protein